ncbi:MAG: TonB-dependent receptor [Luteitalea sp.]|nr:TonB-dependent receptor [Luteitalea sp.]
MLGVSRRELGDLRAGDGRDSHHVLHRLFGLNDDQIDGLLGDRHLDTGFTQSAISAKGTARLGTDQNLTAWYQRSDQDKVHGYKDLWGGLGRLQSAFDPQRLQLLYARYERLDIARLDWLSATFSVNAQDDGSTRQNLLPTDPVVVDEVGVNARGYAMQAGAHLGSRHALVFGGEVYDEHVDARRDETDPASAITVQQRALYPNGSRYTTTGLFLQDQLMNYELGVALNWDRLYLRVQGFDAELESPIVRRTLLFPADAVPSALAGVPVTPLAQTAAQADQGVVSVATSFDPRAVKAFVNEGRARYYGADAVARYRPGQWSLDANYSHVVGHDLSPTRPVRRLPPQQGGLTVRYQPGGLLSWVEATALFSAAQDELSGGDLSDERIGAARRRSDIADFFQSGRIGPYVQPGADGLPGTADDLFGPTGETAAQISDRVLPIGATINGVTVVDDSTPVPLYTDTRGFVAINLRAGLVITRHLSATVALMNALDRNYRVHGSGVDAPGRSVFAALSALF